MNAWLLTWESTTGPAIVPEKRIVAVLSSRRPSWLVREIVDILYRRSVGTAHDMVSLANNREQRGGRYRQAYSQPDRFFYGQNPCIFARIVSDFCVTVDRDRGVEHVQWIEPPYIRPEQPGGLPVEVEPAVPAELTRRLDPLCKDIHD
jgi:hypothetical protein